MDTNKIYAEHIANEYSKKETSKVNQLRKLDAKAKRPACIFAYTFGIVSSLVLGIGMTLAMGVIGSGNIALVGGTLGMIFGDNSYHEELNATYEEMLGMTYDDLLEGVMDGSIETDDLYEQLYEQMQEMQ